MATVCLAECSCFKDLAKMARPLIRRFGLRAEIDAEDVANTALYWLCRAVDEGRAPGVQPDGEFGMFARVLLVRAVLQARRRARSLRRGGSAGVEVVSGAEGAPPSSRCLHRLALDLDGLQATGPSVEDLVNASMEAEYLTERLDDPALKQVAAMRLQGYTVREIARKTRQGRATVNRKILQIRTIWRNWGLES